MKHNGFNQIYGHFNEFSNISGMVRCGCRLDCGGQGTDLKTQTKIGVISKKKKGQRLLGCKIFPLFGLKMTQIVELTGDDLFFFFLEITPIFVFGFRSAPLPRQSSLRPHLTVPLLIKKRWRGHKFRLVKIRHPMSRFLLFKIW